MKSNFRKVMDIGMAIRLRDKLFPVLTERERDVFHELIMAYQEKVNGIDEFGNTNLFGELLPPIVDKYPFEDIWKIYGKKGNKKKCEDLWSKLTICDKKLIFDRVHYYIAATGEIQFRKYFETYLNQKAWNDVVYDRKGSVVFDPEQSIFAYNDYDRPDGFIENGRMWSAERKVWIII